MSPLFLFVWQAEGCYLNHFFVLCKLWLTRYQDIAYIFAFFLCQNFYQLIFFFTSVWHKGDNVEGKFQSWKKFEAKFSKELKLTNDEKYALSFFDN